MAVAQLRNPHPRSTEDTHASPPDDQTQFSIFDLARAAVRILGRDWAVKRGDWGVSATLFNESRTFLLCVDESGDLCLDYTRPSDELLPEVMPNGVAVYPGGMFFEAARATEGLFALSVRVASAVQAAVTGTSELMIEIPAPTSGDELGRAHAQYGPILIYPAGRPLICHSAEHDAPTAAERMVSYCGFTLPACGDHEAAAAEFAREWTT
ncbi:hypothetical protein [Streptomyces sp. NPDC085659]|uniref:hypothetical protein n=1 Tax=Streptomyces sp. NPDC085659 TaxID=3155177 RepID=UPI00344DA5E6